MPACVEEKPIGYQIDELFTLREQKRAFEAKIKEINAAIEERELALVGSLDAAGAVGARGHLASASVVESVVPQVEDWDRFYAFVRRHNKFELLHRRVSTAAYQELVAQRRGGDVPGLVPFTKRSLSLKKVT